jgi:hypothetical protein
MIWLLPYPLPPSFVSKLHRRHKTTEKERQLAFGIMGGGSQIIQRRERLVLYEALTTLWGGLWLEQRLYFKKLMATGSLFLGIDSSGGIDSVMALIPRRNRFLLHV